MDTTRKRNVEIILRPVEDRDVDFLLAVYASGREIELAAVPWDEPTKQVFVRHQFHAQDDFYKQEYPGSTHQVIVFDAQDAGRLYVHRTDDEIAILDMAVLPQFRRNGIATGIAATLQAEAAAEGRSIRIFVESYNPAQKLLVSLGFTKTSDDGMNSRYDWRSPDKK